jgi:GT2 family glycosyltransferase
MLSIIIVNYKSSKDLDACLASITKYEESYLDYEYIIIDNDSDDPGLSELILKYPFAEFIKAPKNGGFAYGNNIGIRQRKG